MQGVHAILKRAAAIVVARRISTKKNTTFFIAGYGEITDIYIEITEYILKNISMKRSSL